MPRQNNDNIQKNRRERRAAKKAADKQTRGKEIPQGVLLTRLSIVSAKVEGLESSLKKLTEVYSANMNAFGRAFAMTDAHLFVLKRISQDIANNSVHYSSDYQKWTKDAPGRWYPDEDNVLDMPYYYDLFNKMQERKVKAAREKEAMKNAPSDKEEEFGGDHGKTEDNGESETLEGDQQSDSEVNGEGRDAQDPVSAVQQPAGTDH